MKILFHLVSGQTLPNYIAAMTINPDVNVFCFTAGSSEALMNLERVIGGKTSSIKIDAYDYEKIVSSIEGKVQENLSDDLILNFTGGTKLMSFAALDVFKKHNGKAIYINTDNNTIISINNNSSSSVEPLQMKIPPSVYLNLQGQKIKQQMSSIDADYERLLIKTADFIIANYRSVYPFIMKFADRYQSIGKTLDYQAGPNSFIKGSSIKIEGGVATFNFVIKDKVVFSESTKNLDYPEFLRGKWFETACYLKIRKLNVFDSVEANIEIDWKGQFNYLKYGKNEIDILCMKGTIPTAFECKSGKINIAAVNKLKAIKDTFLGRFSNVFFISFSSPSADMLERFKEQEITYISYADLNNLKNVVNSKIKYHIK